MECFLGTVFLKSFKSKIFFTEKLFCETSSKKPGFKEIGERIPIFFNALGSEANANKLLFSPNQRGFVPIGSRNAYNLFLNIKAIAYSPTDFFTKFFSEEGTEFFLSSFEKKSATNSESDLYAFPKST